MEVMSKMKKREKKKKCNKKEVVEERKSRVRGKMK